MEYMSIFSRFFLSCMQTILLFLLIVVLDYRKSLDLLFDYCQRWKLVVNTSKTKIRIFRKGSCLPQGLNFYYNNILIETVNNFSYLGVVFTVGGSFSEAQNTLSGKALKSIFKLNKYLYKFTNVSIKDELD